MKLTTENGLPKAGDMIIASGTKPGYGMRALKSSYTVGQLLVDAVDNDDGTASGYIFVKNGYWQAPISFDLSSVFATGDVDTTVDPSIDTQLASLGMQSMNTTTYSGFDQGVVDQIMNGFKTQQSQIDDLKKSVGDLGAKLAANNASTSTAVLSQAVWDGGIVSKDTTFGGIVTFGGHVVFAGDNAGSVTVAAGQTSVRVTFKSSMGRTPSVVATPGSFIIGPYRVTDQSVNGFTVELQQAQTSDITLDWHAFETR